MPRLEGVKVLDMKDGEVTKIEYEGEVYTKKVERKPKPGDKIRIINAHEITGGAYKNGDILTVKEYQPRDDENVEHVKVEGHDVAIYLSEFEFVDDSKAEVEVGDLVKVSGNNAEHEHRDVAGWGERGQGLVNFGEIGKVTKVDSEGIYVKFIEGTTDKNGYVIKHEFYLEHGEYEPITFYDKPAQVGDKILINEHAWGTGGKYGKGDVLTVKEVREDNVVNVEENDRPISPTEFDIIKRSAVDEEIETEKRRAKVGDKIRIVDARLTDGKYENGDVLTVMRVDSNGDVWTTEELGEKFIVEPEYEVIVEENTPQFKYDRELSFQCAGRSINEFKKGDLAYVLEVDHEERLGGKIVEVTAGPYGLFDGGNVRVKFNGTEYIVLGNDLRLVAPAESRTDIGEKSYA